MANLKKIIHINSPEDFITLVSTGQLVKDGKTLIYSPEDTDYRVGYTEPEVPIKEIDVNGAKVTPDPTGKVDINAQTVIDVVISSTLL